LAGRLSGLEIDTEDTAAMLMHAAGGAFIELHVDYVQREYSRTCQVIGETGTIRLDVATGQGRWYDAQRDGSEAIAPPAGWSANDMYQEEARHFLRCLVGQDQPAQDAQQGAEALRLALAARQAAEVQRWVRLDEFVQAARPSATEAVPHGR
jgi:predicted dehydrogenase